MVAFITDNSYLDNPTFRGMRQQLLQAFDEIYLLDLHGNSNKREKAPDGGKDENVFDITQGVAIALFIRLPGEHSRHATVRHADLYGTREEKNAALKRYDLTSLRWLTLTPGAPFYLFQPHNETFRAEYEMGWKVTEIFGSGNEKADQGKLWGLGVITHNDGLLLSFDRAEIERKFSLLASDQSDEQIKSTIQLSDNIYWNTARERKKIRDYPWREFIVPYLYRPFNMRWICYQPNLMEIGRGGASKQITHQIMRGNLVLLTTRQTHDQFDALCTRHPSAHKSLSAYDGTYVFPLYRYPDVECLSFDTERQPNLNPAFVAELAASLARLRHRKRYFHTSTASSMRRGIGRAMPPS